MSRFYFEQKDYEKSWQLKSIVAQELAQGNRDKSPWSQLAVSYIESVKECSLKLKDMDAFVKNEFELINVKAEPLEKKVERFNEIIDRY